jgi:hypothetical protein
MDLTTYSTKKDTGQVVIAKLNDAYVLSVKKFDPDTGQATDPQIQAVDMDQVEAQITNLQAKIDALNTLLADLRDPDLVSIASRPGTATSKTLE